eukprot:195870_1
MSANPICDVLIIGCGVLGASTGYACVKANLSTLVLEQYPTHHHSNGGSFGETRAWRSAYPNPIYAKMMEKSLNIWHDIEQKTSTTLVDHCGGLDFGPSNCLALKETADTLARYKYKFEVLTAHQAMDRFHPIKLPSHYVAIYTPHAYGTINANKALNGLVQCAQSLGCRIKYDQKVSKIEKVGKNKYKVYTEQNGIFIANHVVMSCGAYTLPPIIDKTDVNSKENKLNQRVSWLMNQIMERKALNLVFFRHTKNVDKKWINEQYPVWCEYNDEDLCEFYGMMTPRYTPFGTVYCHKVGDSASNPPDWDHDGNNDFDHICKYTKRRFGDTNTKIFECKKGYISEPKDHHFVMDRVNKNENIYLLFGGSHSFKHAPQIGEIVKNMILNYKTPNHIFSLDRFIPCKL